MTGLITNGGFEDFNTGFGSEYTYTVNETPYDCYPEALHTIGMAAHECTTPGPHSLFHLMETTNVRMWCQTVTVVPGAKYELRSGVTSVHPASPGSL